MSVLYLDTELKLDSEKFFIGMLHLVLALFHLCFHPSKWYKGYISPEIYCIIKTNSVSLPMFLYVIYYAMSFLSFYLV